MLALGVIAGAGVLVPVPRALAQAVAKPAPTLDSFDAFLRSRSVEDWKRLTWEIENGRRDASSEVIGRVLAYDEARRKRDAGAAAGTSGESAPAAAGSAPAAPDGSAAPGTPAAPGAAAASKTRAVQAASRDELRVAADAALEAIRSSRQEKLWPLLSALAEQRFDDHLAQLAAELAARLDALRFAGLEAMLRTRPDRAWIFETAGKRWLGLP